MNGIITEIAKEEIQMIRIGICDDNINDRNLIYDLCQKYLDRKGIRYCLVLFESGEEVLAYCDWQEKERIDPMSFS